MNSSYISKLFFFFGKGWVYCVFLNTINLWGKRRIIYYPEPMDFLCVL